VTRGAAAGLVVGSALLFVSVALLPSQESKSPSPALGPNRRPQVAVAGPALIYTSAPVYESLAALHGDERFPQGAQLMLLRAGSAEPLVPGFAASADPSVSFDGQTLLFAGRKNAGDRWQIWQMAFDGSAPHRVAAAETDLIRPLWMPGGRIVYARRETGYFSLETARFDGSAPLRLTYGPGNYVPDDVLRDGRVLFESGFPLGDGAIPEMYLVYADGSGVESVRCDHGVAREHGRQLLSGDIVFTHGRRLARFTSALAEEAAIPAPAGDYAGDVAELPDGRWLLSIRIPGQKHYSLRAWKPGAPGSAMLIELSDQDAVEPAIIAPRAIPNRHPSALHDWTTGNLLALDARQSRDDVLATGPAAVRVETFNETGSVTTLGTAPVEPDGSFFISAAADRPLRFILLDAAGNPLRAQHGWFWIRRGEQRICVGCHTGPERAPENRVPQVLLRTTTPFDVSGTASPGRTPGGR
jgi:Hydrazine synthase alpha subunit middle domain